ncbi:MAG: ABC transporter substrate-binding protein [Promethearchaeota archaeon]
MNVESKDNFFNSIICTAIILNIVFFSFIAIVGFPPYRIPDYPYVFPQTFYVGTMDGPKTIDPIALDSLDQWGSDSNNVITQVVETLFWYNLNDPTLPLEPLLAESYFWNDTAIELTVKLREHIFFHDGSRLDAYAVKWNLDRILYFTNATGELPINVTLSSASSIYFMPDGITPIINHTELINEMTVNIVLNHNFASLVPLLCYASSSIISPASHSNTTYIDLLTGDLIGTGPYMYDHYYTDTEVRFTRFDQYWRTTPYFEKLIFVIIQETSTRCEAMLGHTVDMIFGYESWACFDIKNDPLTTIVETGPDLIYWYMAFDNYRINATWREAISKAFNYTYIIEEIRMGSAVRGPPCVPSGMPGHNGSVTVAQQNVSEARKIMQRMGFGVGWDVGSQDGDIFTPGAHEINWSDATFFTDAFGHPLDINQHKGSMMNSDLNELLAYNLNKIGITIADTIREWDEFLNDGENGLLRGIWYQGWKPYYIDAFTMLDPLFNPVSQSNFCNLTDPQILAWLSAAKIETNITKRYEIFGNLQYRLFEVLYAHMPLWASKTVTVHGVDVQGYPYNQLEIFLAWPIYRGYS